jgi:hypothetical protein
MSNGAAKLPVSSGKILGGGCLLKAIRRGRCGDAPFAVLSREPRKTRKDAPAIFTLPYGALQAAKRKARQCTALSRGRNLTLLRFAQRRSSFFRFGGTALVRRFDLPCRVSALYRLFAVSKRPSASVFHYSLPRQALAGVSSKACCEPSARLAANHQQGLLRITSKD